MEQFENSTSALKNNRSVLSHNAWLDVCRSAAIVLVLLSHGRHFLTPIWRDAAVLRIGGFLGVELFFVLSGFLVGGILQRSFIHSNGQQSWLAHFLLRRWLRTLPTYYLFLAINAILIANAIAPGKLANLMPLIFFTQNIAWPGPGEFGEAWSLAVEEVFYFIFPLSLLLVGKFESNRRKTFVLVSIALLIAPLLARILFVASADPSWDEGVRKVVIFRLDALMLGVLMGWGLHEVSLTNQIYKQIIDAAAILMIVVVIILFFYLEPTRDDGFFYRVWLFPLSSFAAALTILTGLHRMRIPKLIKASTQKLAHWSYALYLVHMPVFHCITSYSNSESINPWSASLRWICFMIGSICLAAIVTRYFEQPILDWRDRWVPR